jgi:hypothetical protein
VAGTGLGIVPKIALTAFAGASIVQLMQGEIGRHWVELAAVAAYGWPWAGSRGAGCAGGRGRTMIKLFHAWGSLLAGVLLALARPAPRFEVAVISTKAGDQRTAEYLAVNPKGRVPALVTDRAC